MGRSGSYLPGVEKVIKEMGPAASLSMQAAPLVLRYLMKKVIQDAVAGMAQRHPEHDVHKLLNTSETFR